MSSFGRRSRYVKVVFLGGGGCPREYNIVYIFSRIPHRIVRRLIPENFIIENSSELQEAKCFLEYGVDYIYADRTRIMVVGLTNMSCPVKKN